MTKVVFIATFILIGTTRLWACTCIGGESQLKDDVLSSSVIFHGRVVNENDFSFLLDSNIHAPGNQFIRYSFEVKSTYKGKELLDSISIITGTGTGTGGDCGFQFQVGQEYIVYANYTSLLNPDICTQKVYTTNICMPTSLYEVEKEEEILLFLQNQSRWDLGWYKFKERIWRYKRK